MWQSREVVPPLCLFGAMSKCRGEQDASKLALSKVRGGSSVLFPLRLFPDSCPVVVVCACSCWCSPHRAELTYTSSRARVNAVFFFHKDLFAKRAFFGGATPTSLVIRPNGPDKWISLVVAVAGAQIPDMSGTAFGSFGTRLGSIGWLTIRAIAPFDKRNNESSQCRCVLQELIFTDNGAL